eukprot:352474_1
MAQQQTKKNLYKVVLTGGPGGGKTNAIPTLKKSLGAAGFKVFHTKEQAGTYIDGGFDYFLRGIEIPARTMNMQRGVFNSILDLEERVFKEAELYCEENQGNKAIVLCDRGLNDPRAYMSVNGGCDEKEWKKLLKENGMTQKDVDDRYHGVFFLESCAKGSDEAKECYDPENESRLEGDVKRAATTDDCSRKAYKHMEGSGKYSVIKATDCYDDKLDELVQGIGDILSKDVPLKFAAPRQHQRNIP